MPDENHRLSPRTEREARGSLKGVRDTGLVFSATLLTVAGSLAVQTCLAWFLGTSGRGSYAVCVAFASMAAAVFTFGMDRANQFYLLSKSLRWSESLGMALIISSVGSVAAFVIGWSLVQLPIPFFQRASTDAYHIALLLVPTTTVSTSLTLLLEARRRFAIGVIANFVMVTANLILVIYFVGVRGHGVNGALAAAFIAGVLMVVVQLAAARKEGREIRLPSVDRGAQVFIYGIRYYVARLGNVVNAQVGLVVLAFLASSHELGVFATANAIVSRFSMIPNSLNRALQPRLDAFDGRPQLVAQLSRCLMIALTPAFLGLVTLAFPIVLLLFPTAFSPSIPLIGIMAVGAWFRGFCSPFQPYLIAINRPGVISIATAVRVVLNVVLAIALYPQIGVSGAAWAVSLSTIVSCAVMVVAFQATVDQSYVETWLPRRSDLDYYWGIARAIRRKAAIMYDARWSAAPDESPHK